MAQLWQEIAKVPGLTGSWRQRLDQYSQQLYGKNWNGLRDSGMDLLNQISKGNYAQPQAQTTTATTTTPSIAEQYTQAITDQAAKIAAIPTFQQALPFYDAWGQMIPQATAAAESQINPEVMRNYNQQYNTLQNSLASTGGNRFGTGLAGVGTLKASSERDRQSQLQDWLNQYQEGYKTMFYEPSATAWDTSRTQGITPDQTLTKIPTWEDTYGKLSKQYGAGTSASPLYG